MESAADGEFCRWHPMQMSVGRRLTGNPVSTQKPTQNSMIVTSSKKNESDLIEKLSA
jgi:hypothetical protein